MKTSLALCALFGLAACSSLESMVKKPGVDFRTLSIRDASLTEATFVFDFNITNPNAFGVPIGKFTYALELAGKSLVSGDFPSGLRLPANGQAIVSLPVKIKWLEAYGSLQSLFAQAESPYRISGKVGIGPVDLPYSHAGNVTPPRAPDLAVKSLRRTGGTVFAPEFALEVDLKNVNKFTLPIGGLDYRLSLEGKELAGGKSASLSVPPGENSSLRLPLKLSALAAGSAIAQALSGDGVVPYRFRAEMKFPLGQPFALERSGGLPITR